ncbi:MAG: insulinase family protein [Cyanobacteria bacterium J083]|nr:MAG: insulinase family protein [Cyanobacteria bacterium J083]
MKNFPKITIRILIVITTFALVLCIQPPRMIASTVKAYDQISFPPLPEIKLPEYERYQLDNGIIVYLIEDHDLPLVKGTAVIKTGSRWENPDKVGLASLTGTVLRSGGTTKHSSAQINEILEQKAASIETSISKTLGTANFDTLTADLNSVFELFAEILRYPAFEPAKVALAINQTKGAIARRNDNPGDIASREFKKVIYGKDSPYARTVEYETLANIQRNDLINFYQKYFQPENIILGIIGDFQPAEMKTLISNTLGNWQTTEKTDNLTIPTASQVTKKSVFVVDRPQLTQSNILMGHIDGKLNSPDYPALSVLNGVLNGYGGRLFNRIRSKEGLAYSVYGVWNPGYDYPGLFQAGGQTRSEATVPFIQSITQEITKLRNEAITPKELAYAKESILNSFVFNFQSPQQTLSRLLRYEYFNYPENFIFDYQKAVKNTTIADVQRVAQEYLQPDNLVTLVVGNTKQIQPTLDNLGEPVTNWEINN